MLLFWLLSFFVLYRIFTKDYNNGTVDLIYTLLFHVPLLYAVLINTRIVNLYFNKKKYIHYSVIVLLLIASGVFMHYILFDLLADLIFPGYYFISMFSYFEIAQYLLAYILISLMIKLSLNWFELREKQNELERQNQMVHLTNLKAQLNPHFLFNSLNNIYSISNISDKQARSYIIKLSDALRYMLYRTADDKVNLNEELHYLENYIQLEKLRLEEDAHLSFKTDVDKEDYEIAPLILLPIIENCFKHCNKEKIWIEITITVNENILLLEAKNTIDQSSESDVGGIGLNNLKKRLELIYPDNFAWETAIHGNIYVSSLKIKLS